MGTLGKMGVISHLFYSDLLSESISYFRNLPAEADLIITTPERQIDEVNTLLRNIGRTATVLPAGPNGRDVAALVVTAHDYLMVYDLLCFVHDKKTTGGEGDTQDGETYRRLLWDNLLGSPDVIEQVEERFLCSPRLGVLAPPAPYHSSYFLCLGDPWATALSETQKVLNRIGVKRSLSKNDIPQALSTAFWCRPTALKKLFQYPFTYDDFPNEPLALNGAINHGIERAISFVAEDAGYETECIANKQAEIAFFSAQEKMLSCLCRSLAKQYFFMTFKGLLDELEHHELQRFCSTHEELFIYGAGYHGLRLLPILERMGFSAKKFMLSDGQLMPANLPLPVEYLSSIRSDVKVGVIVAAAFAYQPMMKKALDENGWDMSSCYFLK